MHNASEITAELKKEIDSAKSVDDAVLKVAKKAFKESTAVRFEGNNYSDEWVVEAKQRGLISVADNTFASPYVQRPLEHGFDIVVHSVTKYLNGHSDMVGGLAVVGDNEELETRLRFLQNAVGAISGPFDSFLALRGLKTLALRMQRHCENGLAIAEWLEKRKDVRRVIYPGLASHPQHALAKRQMHAFGGMITVVLDRDLAGTKRVLERVQIFALAESLGVTTSQLAIAWVAKNPHVSTVILGASNVEQVHENLGALDALERLDADVMAEIVGIIHPWTRG